MPVRTIVGVIFLVLEIFRLQNGFYGNLKESVCFRLRLVPVNLCICNANYSNDWGSNNPYFRYGTTESSRMGCSLLRNSHAYTLTYCLVGLK